MKIAPVTFAQVAAISATLLLTSGGLARADEYTPHGSIYRSHYDEPRAVVVRRGSIYHSGYHDPGEDFAYAPAWRGYAGNSDYQCMLSVGSSDYAPCTQY